MICTYFYSSSNGGGSLCSDGSDGILYEGDDHGD